MISNSLSSPEVLTICHTFYLDGNLFLQILTETYSAGVDSKPVIVKFPLFLAPAVTVGETEGAMDSTSVFFGLFFCL